MHYLIAQIFLDEASVSEDRAFYQKQIKQMQKSFHCLIKMTYNQSGRNTKFTKKASRDSRDSKEAGEATIRSLCVAFFYKHADQANQLLDSLTEYIEYNGLGRVLDVDSITDNMDEIDGSEFQ